MDSLAGDQLRRLCERIYRAGHSEGWTGNQLRRDTQMVDADKGWGFYVSNGALAKSIEVEASIIFDRGLSQSAQFLLWCYDNGPAVQHAKEAWEALRAALADPIYTNPNKDTNQ